jgi:hypothetical protein
MPASPPPHEPVADPTEPAATITHTIHASWYDPDASSWEPQPAAMFEALRASLPRPPIVVRSRCASDAARPVSARLRGRRA